MNGNKIIKLVEVRTAEGSILATIQITEMEAEGQLPGPGKDEPRGEETKGKNPDGEPMMTDPQKRYLFRLLADRGIENEEAHETLKKRFKVNSLKDVSKANASKEIERLIAEQKGGESYAH